MNDDDVFSPEEKSKLLASKAALEEEMKLASFSNTLETVQSFQQGGFESVFGSEFKHEDTKNSICNELSLVLDSLNKVQPQHTLTLKQTDIKLREEFDKLYMDLIVASNKMRVFLQLNAEQPKDSERTAEKWLAPQRTK
jgi:hypothetical protein